jgi:hypothetical protein
MIRCLRAGLPYLGAYEQKVTPVSTTERSDMELYESRRPVRGDRNGLNEERKRR